MTESPDVNNEISGAVIGNIVQGRDLIASLPVASPIAVSGLPAQPVFVGRRPELELLAKTFCPTAVVAAGRPVVVSAVAGLAGVGKTALAVRAAHDAVTAGYFPGGVVMVDLRGYDPPEERVQPAAALASLLRALGTADEQIPPNQADRERLWRSLLADRDVTQQRMLIVLDNASSTEQVRPLLPGVAGHQVLITSRHSLADIGGARLFEVDVLSAEQAVDLLEQELAAADPDDDRVRAAPKAASRLAQLCGELPLAIRIAAALLAADRNQPIAELNEALNTEQRRLEELDYDGSISVRAAFDLSYHQLTRDQAQLFRLMSLNSGPETSTEAAAALANISAVKSRRTVSQLQRAHLLHPGAIRGRWRMHDLLRQYAAEHAAHDKGHEFAIDRLLRYYTTTCKAANHYLDVRTLPPDHGLRFGTRQKALNWLDIERSNLVDAVTLAYNIGHYAHALALSNALYEFFSLRLHVEDWIATHQLALLAARKLTDRAGEGLVSMHLGAAFGRLRVYDFAAHLLRQAIEIYRDVGNRSGEADALLGLGSTYQSLNRLEEQAHCYRDALAKYRELGDRHGEARALNGIGLYYAYAEVKRPADAEDHYHQALRLCEELGDREGQAGQMGNLGNLYTDLGRWKEALHCHRQALNIWYEFDHRHGQAGQMNNLGHTYRQIGQWNEAADCWQHAADLYGECRDRHAEAGVLRRLGQLYRDREMLDQAITSFTRSLCGWSGTDEAETLAILGDLHRKVGDTYTAVEHWTEALDIFTELDTAHARARANQLQEVLYQTSLDI